MNMYLNILKKDLKRKKTMNVILLLFMIIATMFVSSSVSNIIAALSGTDYFFEQSDLSDYVVFQKGGEDARSELTDALDKSNAGSYRYEDALFVQPNSIYNGGKKCEKITSMSIITSIDNAKLNYFDMDNNRLTSVEKGKLYIADYAIGDLFEAETGDTIEIRFDDTSFEFEIAGACKDVIFGSPMMGNARLFINDEDYQEILRVQEDDSFSGGMVYIYTDDIEAIESTISDVSGIMLNKPTSIFKLVYIVDVVIAAVLLVVSICLIMISVVALRFTISFTISEEFREIGVMKAIGIRSNKIRGLYLTKYIALSIIGSTIGFFASIPFGEMLLRSVSKKMVLGNSNDILISIISAVSVVLTVFMFCWLCTSKIKKSTPLDAIRSGQTGERFNKKSGFRITKSRSTATNFIAVNDVASSPKRYLTLVLTFTICLSLVLVLVITSSTMHSDALFPTMNIAKRDAYIDVTDIEINGEKLDAMSFFAPNGDELLDEAIANLEKDLADNGIPAYVSTDIYANVSFTVNDKDYVYRIQQSIGSNPKPVYLYSAGYEPESRYEVAFSNMVAEKVGVHVGDTIKMRSADGEEDYLITGLFDTMSNTGELVHVHEDFATDYTSLSGWTHFQVDYTDSPDIQTANERFEKLEMLYGENKVMTSNEVAENAIGVADAMDGLKALVLVVAMIVVALVTVLMERSFIAKEKSEVALMKAIGFRNTAVQKIHTMRFAIIAVVSAVIAGAFAVPLTKICITPIFSMMGAKTIDFAVNPLEVFFVYPLAVIVITIVAAYLTSIYTGTIKASDASNIE